MTTIFLESTTGYVAEVDRATITQVSSLVKDLLDEEDEEEGVITLPLLNVDTFALKTIEQFCAIYKNEPLEEGCFAQPVKVGVPFQESVTPSSYADILPELDLQQPDDHTMDAINTLVDAAKYLMMDAFTLLLQAKIGYAMNTISAKYPEKEQFREAVAVFRHVFHIVNDFEEGEEERVEKELLELM